MSVTHLPQRSRAGYIPAAIHPDVAIVRLTRALAAEGLAVSRLADGRLLIHDSPEYRASGETPTGFVPRYLRWQPPALDDEPPEAA